VLVAPISPIAPGSGLFRSQPGWIFAAELVETSRLWGRVVAKIEPEWAEALAGHLVRRTYSEPHWERKQAAVDRIGESSALRRAASCRAAGELRPDRSAAVP